MARRSKEILAAAKAGIQLFSVQIRDNEKWPGMRELSRYLASPQNDGTVPGHLRYSYFHASHPLFRELFAQAAEGATFHLWGRAKVVYAMDDDMFGYLSESSVSSIPTEVLRGIPHPNPYVLLPAPDFTDPETDYYRTHIGVPWGAFVFGRHRNAKLICSTNDEWREDLGLMFLGFIEDGHDVQLQTIRCTVPLREPTLTVQSVVDRTLSGFRFDASLGEPDRNKFEAWLRKYVALVFSSLLYVCTDEPDIETHRPGVNKAGRVKKSAKRHQARPRTDDINEIVQFGFRMGPVLNEARQRWERERRQPGASTGVRQLPKLKWVAPYWVSLDLLGQEAPQAAVVYPVKKRIE